MTYYTDEQARALIRHRLEGRLRDPDKRSPEEIGRDKFPDWLVQRTRDALTIGEYRYGSQSDTPGQSTGRYMARLIGPRVAKYFETGNMEWLVDVIAYAALEVLHPSHPDAHWAHVDEDHDARPSVEHMA